MCVCVCVCVLCVCMVYVRVCVCLLQTVCVLYMQVCRIVPTCTLICGAANTSDITTGSAANPDLGLACLQTLVEEENYDELQYRLFIREIQRLNPTLREGCMFVDGLYELVCSRLPVQVGRGQASLVGGARDFMTVHTTDSLLLQKYWHKPHDPDEHTAYLTIATSFVQYIFKTHGPHGVSEFLQQLDYTVDNPLTERFRFRGHDIVKLEFKWKKFVEAEVTANFRLSILGMLHVLFTHYLLNYTAHLVIILILILADVGLDFLYAIAFAQLISLGFSPGALDLGLLFQWVGVLITSLLVRFVVLLMSAGLLVHVAVGVGNRIRGTLSARFGLVTPLYLTDHSSSSLLTTFSQDVNTIEKVISSAVRAIIAAMVLVATCFIYSAVIVWPLAIYLSGLFLLSQFLNHFVSTRLSVALFAKGQACGKLCDILKEQIDGFLVCRIYQLEGLWKGQMDDAIRRNYTQQARKAQFFSNFCWFFQQMVPNVSIATMLFGIILLSREGFTDFTSGISVFLFYIRVSVGLTAAASMFPELQTASAALGRINALLNDKSHEMVGDGERESKCSESQLRSAMLERSLQEPAPEGTVPSLPISFKGVCFCYKTTAAHWNLYNISLEIAAGERVAMVGTTGSGKSTLLMLAMQLYRPTLGEVVIGGGSSPYYCGLRKISTTFQNNHMFDMSLRENIRLGNLAASNEEVEEAAKRADIHDWIMTLARGYDTSVQSGGRSLSGGQRQRIAIARMLVARSPICFLDEVTSALDPVTETRVFEKLMEVTKGRTVLAVTHKLEQASHFDRIVVMSHGRIKEIGSHIGLLAHRGVYWSMWNNNRAASLGRPVPIPRRQSLGVLQLRETPATPPDLSIEPLSVSRGGQNRQSPVFFHLQPLTEAGESRRSSCELTHSPQQPSSPTNEVAPAIRVPIVTVDMEEGCYVTPPGLRENATRQSTEGNQSCAPCQSSTPVVVVQEPGSAPANSSADNSYTTAQPTQGLRATSHPRPVGVAREEVESKSMREVTSQPHTLLRFDVNQTMPLCLDEAQAGTGIGLKRHSVVELHSSSGRQGRVSESLRSQLEKAAKSDNSLASLASLFALELGELQAAERARAREEGGEVEGGSETSGDTYYPAHC